jgi:uncharacterized protein (DUF433 family)
MPSHGGDRIPQETVKEIERIAGESGRDFSSIAKDLLSEAVRMHRCPGVVFADGVTGRRARISGTGLEVWEIIATYKSVKNSFKRLQNAYHWLTEQQLRAALGYYSSYQDEIDRQIRQNESWSPKKVLDSYPFLIRSGKKWF